jgi:hypothetical protein
MCAHEAHLLDKRHSNMDNLAALKMVRISEEMVWSIPASYLLLLAVVAISTEALREFGRVVPIWLSAPG